jgi:hypothetical protein
MRSRHVGQLVASAYRALASSVHAATAHCCNSGALLRPRLAPIRAESGGSTMLTRAILHRSSAGAAYLPSRAFFSSQSVRPFLRGRGDCAAAAAPACSARWHLRTHAPLNTRACVALARASAPRRNSRVRCSGNAAAAPAAVACASRTGFSSVRAKTRAKPSLGGRLAPCSSRARMTRPRWWPNYVRVAAARTCKRSAARAEQLAAG